MVELLLVLVLIVLFGFAFRFLSAGKQNKGRQSTLLTDQLEREIERKLLESNRMYFR